ncbi:MFS transporter, partial [Streptomyces celluloflavus]
MIGMFRRFRRLLTRRHVAGPAWWSVVSRLPVYLMSLATVLVVREQGGSYAQAGLVSALYTVGMALGSPFLARRAEQEGGGGVLLSTGLVSPPALAVLVLGDGPGTPR